MSTNRRPPREIGAYRVAVKVNANLSANRIILVEGKDDHNVLIRLVRKLEECGRLPHPIIVDTAEDIASPDRPMGNREKVEAVCAGLDEGDACRFVGFVDREYHGFSLTDPICDEINGHFRQGRLLWSRGHSIENYLLDSHVLAHAIECNTECSVCYDALKALKAKLPEAIQLACAIGLTGHETHRLPMLRSSIRWNDVMLDPTIALDGPSWLAYMARIHPKVNASEVFSAISGWLERLRGCHGDTVKWLCDGHTALAMCLAVFQRLVFELTGNDAAEAAKAVTAKRHECVLAAAVKWGDLACSDLVTWPNELVTMLSAS